jgi:small multidrug resistance family-3 protein
MTILKSTALFVLAAIAEIGGAWLVWQSVKEAKPWWWAGLGVVALGIYGFVAAFQPDAHFGRVLAAYGGVFKVGTSKQLSRCATFWTLRRRDPRFSGSQLHAGR